MDTMHILLGSTSWTLHPRRGCYVLASLLGVCLVGLRMLCYCIRIGQCPTVHVNVMLDFALGKQSLGPSLSCLAVWQGQFHSTGPTPKIAMNLASLQFDWVSSAGVCFSTVRVKKQYFLEIHHIHVIKRQCAEMASRYRWQHGPKHEPSLESWPPGTQAPRWNCCEHRDSVFLHFFCSYTDV